MPRTLPIRHGLLKLIFTHDKDRSDRPGNSRFSLLNCCEIAGSPAMPAAAACRPPLPPPVRHRLSLSLSLFLARSRSPLSGLVSCSSSSPRCSVGGGGPRSHRSARKEGQKEGQRERGKEGGDRVSRQRKRKGGERGARNLASLPPYPLLMINSNPLHTTRRDSFYIQILQLRV